MAPAIRAIEIKNRDDRHHRPERNGEGRRLDASFEPLLPQCESCGADARVRHEPSYGAYRGEVYERAGQRQDERHERREPDRVRGRPVRRIDMSEETGKRPVLREREKHPRAGQHLASVVAGHRDHRSEPDDRGAQRVP